MRMNSKTKLFLILLKRGLEANFPVAIILRRFVRSALNSCDGPENSEHYAEFLLPVVCYIANRSLT